MYKTYLEDSEEALEDVIHFGFHISKAIQCHANKGTVSVMEEPIKATSISLGRPL